MSSAETKIITCPECGHENEVKIFRTVNVTTDAELHDLVISGELFRFRCQNCNHEAELKYPVLYNDMKHKFMVYYIPEIDRASVIDEKLEAEYSKYGELEGITRRLVGTFNELKEKKLRYNNVVIASGTSTPYQTIEQIKKYLESN